MKRKIVQFLKRTAVDQQDDIVTELIDRLAGVIETMPEPEVHRVKKIVPLVPFGNVTRAIWVCDNCGAIISGLHKYCNGCGRRINPDDKTKADKNEKNQTDSTGEEQFNGQNEAT